MTKLNALAARSSARSMSQQELNLFKLTTSAFPPVWAEDYFCRTASCKFPRLEDSASWAPVAAWVGQKKH